MGCGFPPHPRERARFFPTFFPLGEILSLFPDTLNFPLAFHLVLGYKESKKFPKMSTKKVCLGYICQGPGWKRMAHSAGWLRKGLAEEMGTESRGTNKGPEASNAERPHYLEPLVERGSQPCANWPGSSGRGHTCIPFSSHPPASCLLLPLTQMRTRSPLRQS